jgi:hypothetical protein
MITTSRAMMQRHKKAEKPVSPQQKMGTGTTGK